MRRHPRVVYSTGSKLRIGVIRENAETLVPMVEELRSGDGHIVLGYASWTAFAAAELEGIGAGLDRENRRELVVKLTDAGMSTRAIAPIVGASNATVHRDLEATVTDETVARDQTGMEVVDAEIVEAPGSSGNPSRGQA